MPRIYGANKARTGKLLRRPMVIPVPEEKRIIAGNGKNDGPQILLRKIHATEEKAALEKIQRG